MTIKVGINGYGIFSLSRSLSLCLSVRLPVCLSTNRMSTCVFIYLGIILMLLTKQMNDQSLAAVTMTKGPK